jgi:hypothetical protein
VARGQNWFLHNGHLVDAGADVLKPMRTDGFTISAFSGAYVLHSLWLYPTFMLLGAAVALRRLRELPLTAKRALVFGLLAVLGGLVTSEAEPLFYFNVRYLAYLLPFLMCAAFTCLAAPPRTRPLLGTPAVVALLCLGTLTTHWQVFAQRERLLAAPIVRAFGDRHEIRRIVGKAPVAMTVNSISTRNYISYVLRRPPGEIRALTPGQHFRGYVFTTHPRGLHGRVVLKDGRLLIIEVR